jgi:hypothetical protein
MPLTLLQMVQAAQAELGLPQASTVIGNTDPTTVQMLALANRTLDEMRRTNPTGWTAMQFEYDLVVPVPIKTTGNLLASFTPIISNIPSTTGILANYFAVSGNDFAQAARVSAVTDANTVVMSMEATNTTPIDDIPVIFSQDTFPEPTGFDWFQNRSMWDRTNRWELIGPDSPQVDQWHRSGIVVTGPRRHFRQLGPYANNFRIWPPPTELTSPLQLVFEYMSTNAVNLQAGSPSPPNPPTYGQYFTSDTDTPLLDDQAIIMGIKWMFWEVKGFGSYVTMQGRWVDYVERLIGRDGAAPTLQLAKRVSPIFISPSNVQDGFFPGPSQGQQGT